MKKFPISLNPEQITSKLGGKLHHPGTMEVLNVAELSEANESSVCFFENSKYLEELQKSKAGLIIVPTDFDPNLKPGTALIFTEKPYFLFMLLIRTWLQICSSKIERYFPKSAVISDSSEIIGNVALGENVVIGENVIIDQNTRIDSNCVIEKNVQIGTGCYLFPNTTIYEDTVIRNNVTIHSGCVIGADGFGYILHQQKQEKIPQVGNVIIEDDVEIGANSTIDRATIGSTIIGKGTKIDNLVQVGHNCRIGENSILCAQVGLAGSTEIGDMVYLAGQVGVAGHLKIDDGAMIGAQSGIAGNVPKDGKYFGSPAVEARLQMKIISAQKRLPEIAKHYNKEKKKLTNQK